MAPDVIFYKTRVNPDGTLGADAQAPPRPGWIFGEHLLAYLKTKPNPTRGLSLREIETQHAVHIESRHERETVLEPFHTPQQSAQYWRADRQRADDFVDWCREYWKDQLLDDADEPMTAFISEN